MTRPARAGGRVSADRKRPKTRPKTRLKRRSPSPMLFTDELIADARRRYEETPEAMTTIAFDLGIHRSTLRELALRRGWVRYRPQPKGVSPASRLLERAQSLVAETRRQMAAATAACGGGTVAESADGDMSGPAGPLDIPAMAKWLRCEVQAQIGVVRQLREQERAEPLTEDRAVLLARILASLTEALIKLKRLDGGAPAAVAVAPDDLPENIDEFRFELARRIDAFVASRLDASDAGRADADAPVAEAGR